MNAAVGIATAIVTLFTGLGDPILWGTVAFLLNYVPILG
jgi:predicted PurR-regulated permease PerM